MHPYASTIYWASSPDGRNWAEQGEALGKGPKGSWDSFGVITPYTLVVDGKYYLFYTAVSDSEAFDPNKALRHMGVAVADHVRGPWKKLPHPVISPGRNPEDWDSLVVDDACIIVRGGKYWLYYKGRNAKATARQTQWGLAVADKPAGPYVKYKDNPVLDSGHTVNIWPHRQGVAALVDNAGPRRYSVQWSPDGIRFETAAELDFVHTGTAAYSPDAFLNVKYGGGVSWGVAQHQDAKSLRLVRFDCDLEAPAEFPELAAPKFRIVPAEGLGPEKGVCRRDPSDVIRVGNTYYVWYTKVVNGLGIFQYPSGYSGAVWYAASGDGIRWKERGECVRKGAPNAWDGHGVFTPGILAADGMYYLFYDSVPNPMTPETPTGMGIAVSKSPDGPWEKYSGNPILKPSGNPGEFDSFRVDDSCLLIRGGKYWLYYKGRQAGRSPAETKWGAAIADRPTGPYVKHKANPLTNSGHEVLAWPHREGVALLIGPTGPERNTIQFAEDGVRFHPLSRITNAPKAPGGYRPDAFTGAKYGAGMPWGIAMENGPDPYLVRFECNLVPPHYGHR